MLSPLMLVLSFGAADDDLKTQLAKFKGEWRIEKAIKNGRVFAADEIDRGRFFFEGNTIRVREDDEKDEAGTFELDPAKSPKTIDMKLKQDKVVRGIFKWDGKSLILAYRKSGERPAEFESKSGSQVIVIHLVPAK